MPGWRSDRRGDPAVPELATDQIEEQLGRAVDRVMAEGSLYDRGAGGAGDQAGAGRPDRGRVPAARLPHHPAPLRRRQPVDTGAMAVRRRVSAIFKDLPGGQVLGPTYDYTHRLLDFGAGRTAAPPPAARAGRAPMPPAFAILGEEGLIEPDARRSRRAGDLTRAAAGLPRRARRAAAGAGARRRGLPAGAGLLHPARLRRHAPVRGRAAGGHVAVRSSRRSWASPSTSATSC